MKKNNIKKAGIIAFAITGGVFGGGVTLAGKITKNSFVENLGEDIVDSAIYTGELLGEAVGGVNELVAGKINNDATRKKDGIDSLKDFAKNSIHNVATNLTLLAENSEEVVVSLIENDKKKALAAAKTLGKIIFIGTLTVGAIKIDSNK
jgi:hypothetical protein